MNRTTMMRLLRWAWFMSLTVDLKIDVARRYDGIVTVNLLWRQHNCKQDWSLNPSKFRVSIFTKWACFFSSKKTFSGSTILPLLTHKSSRTILWSRSIRQFLNLMSFKGEFGAWPDAIDSDIAQSTSQGNNSKTTDYGAINFTFFYRPKFWGKLSKPRRLPLSLDFHRSATQITVWQTRKIRDLESIELYNKVEFLGNKSRRYENELWTEQNINTTERRT